MRYLFPIIFLAACTTQPPSIEYKTQVIDTSCTKFSVIKIPADDLPKISDTLKQRILVHDRTYIASCPTGQAKSPIK